MAYIGNQNYQAYVTLSNQTFVTSGATTIYALNYTVTNANNISLYINNVAQQPGVAYTASGNTLTLTTATSSSMYAVYLGQGIQTVQPGTSSVGTSQITTGAVGVSQLSATGTPGSTNFLRGDNTWASAGATAGQVIQVVSTNKTDTFASSSLANAFQDVTGLSVTITPSSSANTILVLATVNHGVDGIRATALKLLRNSTAINIGTASGTRPAASTVGIGQNYDSNRGQVSSINFLDSPATTSAITYKIQVGILESTGNVARINTTNSDSDNTYIARSASTITVMEIKG